MVVVLAAVVTAVMPVGVVLVEATPGAVVEGSGAGGLVVSEDRDVQLDTIIAEAATTIIARRIRRRYRCRVSMPARFLGPMMRGLRILPPV